MSTRTIAGFIALALPCALLANGDKTAKSPKDTGEWAPFNFVKHGTIVWKGDMMHLEQAGIYYRLHFWKSVKLDSNPDGVNIFFAHEFRNESEVHEFVDSGELENCVFALFTPKYGKLITKAYASENIQTVSEDDAKAFGESPVSREEAKALTRKLQHYASGFQYSIDQQTWRMAWNVRTRGGAIIRITVSGGTAPLRILEAKRETLLPDWTFPQFLYIGGD